MTTSPPFMSMMPGPARGPLVDALELLERAVRLEHRVEMADEQDARPGARMLGDEMAGALERRAVDPARREAERVELGAEDARRPRARRRSSACRC